MRMLPAAAAPTVAAMAKRRPRTSESQPKRKPPKGRAAKPTAKTISVDRKADTGSSELRNWVAKKGEKIAKIPQSNHSRALPTPVPTTVLARRQARALRVWARRVRAWRRWRS